MVPCRARIQSQPIMGDNYKYYMLKYTLTLSVCVYVVVIVVCSKCLSRLSWRVWGSWF
jgi:ATP/ADP translocase